MDTTEQDVDAFLAASKSILKRVARPVALAFLAYILSTTQRYFGYPNFVLASVVFVLASSTVGARAAYAVVFFLTGLILLPPELSVAVQKVMASIMGRSI